MLKFHFLFSTFVVFSLVSLVVLIVVDDRESIPNQVTFDLYDVLNEEEKTRAYAKGTLSANLSLFDTCTYSHGTEKFRLTNIAFFTQKNDSFFVNRLFVKPTEDSFFIRTTVKVLNNIQSTFKIQKSLPLEYETVVFLLYIVPFIQLSFMINNNASMWIGAVNSYSICYILTESRSKLMTSIVITKTEMEICDYVRQFKSDSFVYELSYDDNFHRLFHITSGYLATVDFESSGVVLNRRIAYMNNFYPLRKENIRTLVISSANIITADKFNYTFVGLVNEKFELVQFYFDQSNLHFLSQSYFYDNVFSSKFDFDSISGCPTFLCSLFNVDAMTFGRTAADEKKDSLYIYRGRMLLILPLESTTTSLSFPLPKEKNVVYMNYVVPYVDNVLILRKDQTCLLVVFGLNTHMQTDCHLNRTYQIYQRKLVTGITSDFNGAEALFAHEDYIFVFNHNFFEIHSFKIHNRNAVIEHKLEIIKTIRQVPFELEAAFVIGDQAFFFGNSNVSSMFYYEFFDTNHTQVELSPSTYVGLTWFNCSSFGISNKFIKNQLSTYATSATMISYDWTKINNKPFHFIIPLATWKHFQIACIIYFAIFLIEFVWKQKIMRRIRCY